MYIKHNVTITKIFDVYNGTIMEMIKKGKIKLVWPSPPFRDACAMYKS